MSSPSPLLAGVTVLDLASVGPAARASRVLADYGARVAKVGPTSRRGSAQIEPPYYSYGAGRGFEKIRIDLKAPQGRDAFLDLAGAADVVIESFRPGVVDRLGIGYEAVSARNPGIVYCSTSGYGQDGPYAQWAGHDLNYLALGGYLHCSGRGDDGGPALPGATVADSAAGGMQAVIAILAALLDRARSGKGRHLDVSVAEGVLSLMALNVDQYLATGEEVGPRSTLLTGRYACYDVYAARDDRWLAVGAIEPAFFANLCKALSLEKWIPHQMDDDHQDEIRRDFRAAFGTRDRDAWIAELAPSSTCVSPVNSIAEVCEDPHFLARGVFAQARHRERGDFRQLGSTLAGGARGTPPHSVRDPSETDTDALLAGSGLPEEKIAALRSAGVVE